MPGIHILRVGPQASCQYKGHDIVGADLFRNKYPEQDIHFYCLEEEVEHYNEYFNGNQPDKKTMIIHGIESLVEAVDTPHKDKFTAYIDKIKERVCAFKSSKAKIQE